MATKTLEKLLMEDQREELAKVLLRKNKLLHPGVKWSIKDVRASIDEDITYEQLQKSYNETQRDIYLLKIFAPLITDAVSKSIRSTGEYSERERLFSKVVKEWDKGYTIQDFKKEFIPVKVTPPASPQVAPVAHEEKTVKNQFSLRTALVSAGMAAAGTMEFLRQQNLTDIAGSFGGKAAEYLTSANHYHHLKLSDSVKATEAIQQWTTNAQTAGFHGNSVEAVGKNISHFANQDVVGHLCAGIGTAAAIHAALGIARDVHKMATGQETVTGGKVADLALKAAQVGVGAAAHAGFVNPATGAVIAACRLGLHLSQEKTLDKAIQLKNSIEKNCTSGELQGVRQVLSAMHLVGATVYCETAQGANNIRKAFGNTIGNSMQALQSRFTPEQQQTVEQGIEMAQAMINNAPSDTVAPELRALPEAMKAALKTDVLSTKTAEQLQAGGQMMQYSTHEDAHVVMQALNILKEGHNLNAGLENAANNIVPFNRGSEAVNA